MLCPTCGYQIDQYHLGRCPNCGNRLPTQAGQAAKPTTENPPPQQPPNYPYPQYPQDSPPSGYGQYAPPSYPMAPGYPPPSGYPPQPPQGNYPQQGAYPPYLPPPHSGYPQPFAPLTQQETGGGFAIAGLVLGIVSIPIAFFAICGYITSILGIIFSLLGRQAPAKRTMATVGLVLSVLGFSASIASSIVGVMIGQHQYAITGSGSTFATATATAFGPTKSNGTVSFGGTAVPSIPGSKSYSRSYATSKGDALFVSASPTGSYVGITVTGYNGDNWSVQFEAPGTVAPINGKPAVLVPGTYSGAHRYPFNGNGPGLELSNTGCNTSTGSFTILAAVFGPPGYVQKFDATFVQHCEGLTPETRGQVHIANPPAGQQTPSP